MKVQKKYLSLLNKVLNETKPKFVEARFRDRFMKKLEAEIKQFDDDRIKLCVGLCKKDKDKKPVLENNQYQFTPENLKKFSGEFKLLVEEEFSIPLEGDEKNRLIKLIDSTNYIPEPGESIIIDEEIISKIK